MEGFSVESTDVVQSTHDSLSRRNPREREQGRRPLQRQKAASGEPLMPIEPDPNPTVGTIFDAKA
jgi:hypothetical protein